MMNILIEITISSILRYRSSSSYNIYFTRNNLARSSTEVVPLQVYIGTYYDTAGCGCFAVDYNFFLQSFIFEKRFCLNHSHTVLESRINNNYRSGRM